MDVACSCAIDGIFINGNGIGGIDSDAVETMDSGDRLAMLLCMVWLLALFFKSLLFFFAIVDGCDGFGGLGMYVIFRGDMREVDLACMEDALRSFFALVDLPLVDLPLVVLPLPLLLLLAAKAPVAARSNDRLCMDDDTNMDRV